MKKILLIGGCGYIGSRLFLHLKEKYNTTSVDLEYFGNVGIPNIKENYSNLKKDFLSQFTDIILLAGHSSVKMCEENMLGCFKNNVQYFVELIEKISSNQKLIYASSSSVYGNVNRNIVSENCEEYVAGSFYDLSKAEIDHYIKIFDKIEYYGLRFGTVNGFSPNFRNDIMINAMSISALNKKEINVYNPMVRRPILWIDDLCNAVNEIIENGNFHKRGIYNLASYNSTVDIIGRKVLEIFSDSKLSIIENNSTDKNLNKNTISKVYDFAIDSSKFENAFNFKFNGESKIIAEQIKKNYSNIKISANRNKKDIII